MQFTSCRSHTVGAEWELQLLNAETLDLTPGIESILDAFDGNQYVKPEFFESCVELNTPVCSCSSDIERHLQKLAADVLRICREHRMDLAGAGTHPFCRRLATITPLPRYKKLESEHGYIGHAQIAFATHVHVGMSSGDDAVRAMRFLTPCLPILIALTANSPFWRGHYTGYASYRRRLLTAAKSYGIPPYFESWQAFEAFFEMARRAGSVRTIKDIHWDMRTHPDFGTIEFRVMDAQASVADVAFIAGLLRVLVAWIGESTRAQIEATAPRHLSAWIDRENHFRASHWGMEADVIDGPDGSTRPITSYFPGLADAIQPKAAALGEQAIVDRLRQAGQRMPGYRQQQMDFEANDDLRDVAQGLRNRLRAGLVE